MRIGVLGAGAWGTALAISLSGRHAVTLWGRDAALVAALKDARLNERYLPGVAIPPGVSLDASLDGAIAGADLLLVATSTAGLAPTIAAIGGRSIPLLWACKGFDRESGRLPHEIAAAGLAGGVPFGALSGPSFALEVARGLPCALTLASNDGAFARGMATTLNGPALRIYSSDDLVGVELGGALKNVMAIAAGICDGMSLGMNARAALITRGLAEMTRLGAAMGGRAETFMGLTGLGDLVLTATGDLSRNRSVGVKLAEGMAIDAILAELGHVAEGVNSARAALRLARAHGADMPITEAVNAVLFDRADPRETVKKLLSREARPEAG